MATAPAVPCTCALKLFTSYEPASRKPCETSRAMKHHPVNLKKPCDNLCQRHQPSSCSHHPTTSSHQPSHSNHPINQSIKPSYKPCHATENHFNTETLRNGVGNNMPTKRSFRSSLGQRRTASPHTPFMVYATRDVHTENIPLSIRAFLLQGELGGWGFWVALPPMMTGPITSSSNSVPKQGSLCDEFRDCRNFGFYFSIRLADTSGAAR